MTENLQKVGGGEHVVLEKLRADFGGAWLRAGEDPDERVKCVDCAHRMTVEATLKFTSADFEKVRKSNRFQWMYPVAKIARGGVTVPYQNSYCAKTKLDPIPIPHRCELFKAKAKCTEEALNWMDDDDTPAPAAPKQGTPRAGQAGDVAARVPPRRNAGGDTEWWL